MTEIIITLFLSIGIIGGLWYTCSDKYIEKCNKKEEKRQIQYFADKGYECTDALEKSPWKIVDWEATIKKKLYEYAGLKFEESSVSETVLYEDNAKYRIWILDQRFLIFKMQSINNNYTISTLLPITFIISKEYGRYYFNFTLKSLYNHLIKIV